MPYDERPISIPLDREECRTALWRCKGNISEAAVLLKVTSRRLRSMVSSSPYLQAEIAEAAEQLKDQALRVVSDALFDEEDKSRQDQMARFVLTQTGADRGFGKQPGNAKLSLNTPKGTLTVTWGDGSSIVNDNSEDSKVIEGEVVSR